MGYVQQVILQGCDNYPCPTSKSDLTDFKYSQFYNYLMFKGYTFFLNPSTNKNFISLYGIDLDWILFC